MAITEGIPTVATALTQMGRPFNAEEEFDMFIPDWLIILWVGVALYVIAGGPRS